MAGQLDEPLFVISVAARLVKMHPQTLRKYEREGLIAPSRTHGNLRLYSDQDIERLRQVKFLVENRGLNVAGVQLALELTEQLRSLQSKIGRLSTSASKSGASVGAGYLGQLYAELEATLADLGFIEERSDDPRRQRGR